MNKLRPKRITLTLCETLIYKPPRIRNPRARKSDLRSRDNLDRPSRAQNWPYCSRGDLDRLSRAQNWPYCSRGELDRPSRAPELALLLTRRPRQTLPCAEQALLLTRRPLQALPCARKSLLLTRPMNMTAGAPERRFHARKTILREGNQLVAELDFPVAEFVEALVTSTGSVPYMT